MSIPINREITFATEQDIFKLSLKVSETLENQSHVYIQLMQGTSHILYYQHLFNVSFIPDQTFLVVMYTRKIPANVLMKEANKILAHPSAHLPTSNKKIGF